MEQHHLHNNTQRKTPMCMYRYTEPPLTHSYVLTLLDTMYLKHYTCSELCSLGTNINYLIVLHFL